MKLYINALVVSALSSVVANTGMTDEPDCNGLKRLVANDNPYLTKNRAICDGPWRLGINKNGVFALWNDGNIFQEFATDADILEVSDTDDGKEAFASVYDAEGQIIW